MSDLTEQEINAIVARLVHMTNGVMGRDWNSGREFVIGNKGDELPALRDALRVIYHYRRATATPLGDIAELVKRLHAATMRFDWSDVPDDEPLPAVPLLREAATSLTSLQAKMVEAQDDYLRRHKEATDRWLQLQMVKPVLAAIAALPDDTKCNDGMLLSNADDSALACGINLLVAVIRRARTIHDSLKEDAP